MMSPGLLEWPWTQWLLTLFHSCSLFSCSWLLLISLFLIIYESFLLLACSCSFAVGLIIRKLGLSVRLLVQLLPQRPRWSTVQGSSPPGHQVITKLRFVMSCWLGNPRVLSLSASSKLPPHTIPMPMVQSAKGKDEVGSRQLPLKNVVQKWNMSLSLISHWLELSPIDAPGCKGGWEM